MAKKTKLGTVKQLQKHVEDAQVALSAAAASLSSLETLRADFRTYSNEVQRQAREIEKLERALQTHVHNPSNGQPMAPLSRR